MTDLLSSSFSNDFLAFYESSEKRRRLDWSSEEINAELITSLDEDKILNSAQTHSSTSQKHFRAFNPQSDYFNNSLSVLTDTTFPNVHSSKDQALLESKEFFFGKSPAEENKMSPYTAKGSISTAAPTNTPAEFPSFCTFPSGLEPDRNLRTDSENPYIQCFSVFSQPSLHFPERQPSTFQNFPEHLENSQKFVENQNRQIFRPFKRGRYCENGQDHDQEEALGQFRSQTGVSVSTTQTFLPKKTVIRVKENKSSPTSCSPNALTSPSFSLSDSGEEAKEARLWNVGVVAEVSQVLTRTDSELSSLREQQATTDLSLKHSVEVQELKSRLEALKGKLADCQKNLQKVQTQHLLDVCLSDRILSIQQHLSIVQKQIELYVQEIALHSTSNASPKCVAALAIIEQPFPCVIKKQTRLSSPIVVKLLDGAKTKAQRAGKVRAFLIWEDYQAKKPPVTTESNVAELDEEGLARFGELRFPQGTRLKMVRLQFVVDLKYQSPLNGSILTATVESDTSSPFIIVTNENQWEDAEGILLKRDAFNGQTEINWSQFVNAQQLHFVRATRQDAQKPQRALGEREFDYLKELRFNGKSQVTQHDFDKFWSWFGKVLHKIRHQRVIHNLWSAGFLYGLISKEDATRALHDRPLGTFLVRFSERKPGSFAVSFVCQTSSQVSSCSEVRHMLIPVEEISGSRSLVDFLLACPNLSRVLQLEKRSYQTGFEAMRERTIEALKEFQSRPTFESLTGYQMGLMQALSPATPFQNENNQFDSPQSPFTQQQQ